MEEAKKAVEAWALQPEDALSYALFPAVAKDFLMKKYAQKTKRDIGLETLVDGTGYPV